MFYHIRIDYYDRKLKANQTVYEYDYGTEEEVLEKIVVPFVAEKRMFFSSSFLSADDRRQLSIYQTERDIQSMVIMANQAVRPGVFFVYHKDNLLNANTYAKEITKEITQRAVDIIAARKLRRQLKAKRMKNTRSCLSVMQRLTRRLRGW